MGALRRGKCTRWKRSGGIVLWVSLEEVELDSAIQDTRFTCQMSTYKTIESLSSLHQRYPSHRKQLYLVKNERDPYLTPQAIPNRHPSTKHNHYFLWRGSTSSTPVSYFVLLIMLSTGPKSLWNPSFPSVATLTSVLLTTLAARGASLSNANSPK